VTARPTRLVMVWIMRTPCGDRQRRWIVSINTELGLLGIPAKRGSSVNTTTV
jgi:hypothetical protein